MKAHATIIERKTLRDLRYMAHGPSYGVRLPISTGKEVS